MTRSSSLLAGCTLALLVACGGKKAELPKPAPSLTVTMRAVDDDAFLLADNANVFADSLRKVIRDSIEFKTVWERAVSRSSNKPPRPVVDFTKEMVVLAAAGRMKPGDIIHIDSVGNKGALTVIVIRTTQACQAMATSAFPFEMARIPRNNGDDTFREHVMKAPECQ